jgi:glutamate-1-semialdehyde 2,1-aminomutase
MKYADSLAQPDRDLVAARLRGFVPSGIYDIHAHLYEPAHFPPGTWKFLAQQAALGVAEHRSALSRYMPAQTIHGLYFGLPHKTADRPAANSWAATEVASNGTPLSRALMLASPEDDPRQVATELRSGRFCGLKVYHCYAHRPDTMNARVSEFAPDWMWELLHEVRGVLMLHLVRDDAMADPDNQRDLRRLCRAYPNMRLVLAHVARSFNYRNARPGLRAIADLDNAFVDTSAICEGEAFRAAIEMLGPRRILWGSDFPISEARGRCVTTGSTFFWLSPETLDAHDQPATPSQMTLIGIESLLALREACEDSGLTRSDLDDIFHRNAIRLLNEPCSSRREEAPSTIKNDGPLLWQRAREVISCGTGLLSKRAEVFNAPEWPAYFSRASGCQVWDLANRRHFDFVGGIGAVLLGYADPEVTAAVKRRLNLGTYCSLVNPQEVELAEALLALHPWAGKVRYARGGGEAMALAVRTARAATGRSGVAFCGYHGWHDWYLAANLGSTDALNGHLLPGLAPLGVPRELRGTSVPFRYNDLASLDAALAQLDGNLAAVVMEPMRSQMPADDFVAKAAARCRAANAVFVIDEVTSGLRFGFPGALSRLNIEPDLVVYAKAMSNGFPFGVVIGKDVIMKSADASFISSSYWTDGVGPAAALAVLEKAQRLHLHELIWQRGTNLQASLKLVADKHPLSQLVVGGMPAIPTVTFNLGSEARSAQTFFVRKMLARGFLVSSVFYLMLAHEDDCIKQLLEAVEGVLGELDQSIISGSLATEKMNSGLPTGFARLA